MGRSGTPPPAPWGQAGFPASCEESLRAWWTEVWPGRLCAEDPSAPALVAGGGHRAAQRTVRVGSPGPDPRTGWWLPRSHWRPGPVEVLSVSVPGAGGQAVSSTAPEPLRCPCLQGRPSPQHRLGGMAVMGPPPGGGRGGQATREAVGRSPQCICPPPGVPTDLGPDLRHDHVLPGGEGRHLRVGGRLHASLPKDAAHPDNSGPLRPLCQPGCGGGEGRWRSPWDPRPGPRAPCCRGQLRTGHTRGLQAEGLVAPSVLAPVCFPEQCLPGAQPGPGWGLRTARGRGRGPRSPRCLRGAEPRRPHSMGGQGSLPVS